MFVSSGTQDRPQPVSLSDQRRWQHSALRFDMLAGQWEHHLQLALSKHVSATRRVAWGLPDFSSCLFSSIVGQLAGPLYDQVPQVTGSDALVERIDAAELWPLMQDHAVNLVGLREVGMRLDYDADHRQLTYRPMMPFDLVVKGHRHQRHVPVVLGELQLVEHGNGDCEWVWEVFDVEDPANPSQRLVGYDKERRPTVDRTAELLGEDLSGDAYPWRWTQGERAGQPFIPAVVHHARRQARMWDAWRGAEVVFGSLTVGVLQTMFVHVFKDASFPTAHAIGLEPRAVTVSNPGTQHRIASIESDPGSTNLWDVASGFAGQPQIVQLGPGGDPVKMGEALEGFRASIAEFAGVSPGDIQRRSDPRSGYAISISNAGLRAAQRRIEPQLRAGDLALLERSAAILNLAEGGGALPESGYSIVYPAVPMSPEERQAQREDQAFRLDRGLASPLDVFIERNPGMSREAALREMQRIRAEREALAVRAASPNIT